MSQAKVRRMFTVESAQIHKIGFDHLTPGEGAGYMVVQFSNFDVWAYPDVTWVDYLYVANAASIGQAFNQTIKPKYKGVKLTSNDTHVVAQAELSVKPQPKKEVDAAPMMDVLGSDIEREAKGPRRKR